MVLSSFSVEWNNSDPDVKWGSRVIAARNFSCSFLMLPWFFSLWTSHLTAVIFSCLIFVLETEISVSRFHAYSYLEFVPS